MQFSFCIAPLCGFGVRVTVTSKNKFDNDSTLWNILRSIDNMSSLKVSKNFLLKPSDSGLFLVERLLITVSVPLGFLGIFKLFI